MLEALERFLRRRRELLVPLMIVLFLVGFGLVLSIVITDKRILAAAAELAKSPLLPAVVMASIGFLGWFAATYLRVFDRSSTQPAADMMSLREVRLALKETRAALERLQGGHTVATANVNIDDAFKSDLLERLRQQSGEALTAFVESAAFKKAAETNFKEEKFSILADEMAQLIVSYKFELNSWRRNANVAMVIGLMCAIAGIAVMWQTLVGLSFDSPSSASWNLGDLYKFLARFGLVLIIESVAFFFLKLYREDRNMIRYFRNEITNLELKTLALKSSIVFGKPETLSRVLQALAATERNFLLKKGERVLSEFGAENSEMMIERILERSLPAALAKATGKKTPE